MSKYYECQITKMTEEDVFNDGCQPYTWNDHGVIMTLKADTLEELIKKVESNYGKIDTPDSDDETLSYQRLENKDGDESRDSELDQWKKGLIKLWSVTYNYYFYSIEKNDADNQVFYMLNKDKICYCGNLKDHEFTNACVPF